MRPFSHPTSARPAHLILALLFSIGLAACGGESSETLLNQAKASLAAGDHKAAIIQLKSAIQKDERNAEARYQLGSLQLEEGQYAAAEKEFRRAREAGLAADRINPLLARALIRQDAFQRMLDEIPQPAEGSVTEAVMLVARADAQLGLGHKEEARHSLERALTIAPRDADTHLALARLALVDGKPEAAFQEVGSALEFAPKHRDGWLFKAELLRATGKPKEAVAAYQTVLQIDPRHQGARLALAGIAIAENRLAEARREVDTVLKAAPGNLQGRYTQALIDFREKKTEAARDHLATVLKTAPDYLLAVLLGGAIEYTLGNMQTAESHLSKVVKAAPRNSYARRLLAATQLRQGRPDDAARTLAPAGPDNSNDAGIHVVAGEIALAKKDFAKASAHFEKAAQLSPESAAIRTELGISRLAQGDSRAMADLQAAAGMEGAGSRADNMIILNQIKQQKFDAALASVAALEKKQPASPQPWNYRGAVYMGKKDPARARESFSHALKLDPKFFPAAANLAQLDLQDNQPAAAKNRFEGILKADPKHLQAMLALANLSLRQKDEKAYTSWLEKAASANPQAMQPRVLLARHLLARGENAQALSAARAAVNAQPANPVALDLLGTTQFATGDKDNALGTYRKLSELLPDQAAPRFKLAQVQIAMKQTVDARKTLQDALRLQPGMLEAQLMLGGLEIQSVRYDDAMKLAQQIQQQKPGSPAGPMLEGDVALARKQYNAAIAAYERAHKLGPSGAMLIRQHRALAGAGRPEEGEKRLAAWLASQPQDGNTRLYLAENLNLRGQYQAAAEHYLTLNQQNPGNLVVLNNLAWALQQQNDPRALGYAEQAFKLQPGNPAVMDTLGWLLVRQGQSQRGIKLLQQALSKAPDAAEIQYHLAAAFARSGDRARAQSELERLLASGMAFPQEQEARALLQQLKGKTR